jgi:hypothetical protein
MNYLYTIRAPSQDIEDMGIALGIDSLCDRNYNHKTTTIKVTLSDNERMFVANRWKYADIIKEGAFLESDERFCEVQTR